MLEESMEALTHSGSAWFSTLNHRPRACARWLRVVWNRAWMAGRLDSSCESS
ncbi:hypothetical protein ACFFX0_13740 [Citricoccus parietis]|uniref:Uncharacterized protein n=1 Tax=Citricoccus parietis TaxID=592307 RepID=A0ABV5FZV9_9MICC